MLQKKIKIGSKFAVKKGEGGVVIYVSKFGNHWNMIMMKTVHKIWINGDGQICPDGHSAILVLCLLLYNDSCMRAG